MPAKKKATEPKEEIVAPEVVEEEPKSDGEGTVEEDITVVAGPDDGGTSESSPAEASDDGKDDVGPAETEESEASSSDIGLWGWGGQPGNVVIKDGQVRQIGSTWTS